MSEVIAVATNSGVCPYCGSNNYDAAQTEERMPTQDFMKCNICDHWSIREKKNFRQYPLQVTDDKESGPVTKAFQ